MATGGTPDQRGQSSPWNDPRTIASYERWAHPETSRLASIALEMSGIPPGSTVLDAGAGLGALAIQAADRGCRVTAIDNASVMIERLAQRLAAYPGSTAEIMNFDNLPFRDNSFDAAFGVLSVTLSPDRDAALKQLMRVVRPGGAICLVDWATLTGSPGIRILMRALDHLADFEAPELPAVGAPTPDALAQVLRTAGCAEVFAQTVEIVAVLPAPDDFYDEYLPNFAGLPWIAQLSEHRDTVRKLLATEVERVVRPGSPTMRVQIAVGFLPDAQQL